MTCVFPVLSGLSYCNEKIFKKSRGKLGTRKHLHKSLQCTYGQLSQLQYMEVLVFLSGSLVKKSASVLHVDYVPLQQHESSF